MSVLLFKLHNVSEDEASDVRQLMVDNGFRIYETQAGFFGMGVAAIWLEDSTEFENARKVIDAYQAQRSANQRALYEEQKAKGEVPTLAKKLATNPIRVLVTLAVIVLVVMVSLVPIWGFIK